MAKKNSNTTVTDQKPDKRANDLNASAIGIIERLAILVIPRMDKEVQAPFLLFVFIAVLLLPACLLLKSDMHRMIIISGVFACNLAMGTLMYVSFSRKRQELFSFDVPRNKLPGKETAEVKELMEELKGNIETSFKKLYSGAKGLRFRTNIFTFHEISGGSILLKIHDNFRYDMSGDIDEDVALMPGVGSTGTCFRTRRPNVSIKHEKWNDREGVNNVLSKKFDSGLNWIISYPIIDKQHNVLAVLNVDCLGFEISEDILGQLESQLKSIQAENQAVVDKISGIFSKFPKDQILIMKKKLSGK
ncbi:MAG: hypothetical protein JXB34_06570 [Bacteroidales bacterium]|nr:hypothetical protein [Bacteroidales bacterium]